MPLGKRSKNDRMKHMTEIQVHQLEDKINEKTYNIEHRKSSSLIHKELDCTHTFIYTQCLEKLSSTNSYTFTLNETTYIHHPIKHCFDAHSLFLLYLICYFQQKYFL